MTSAIIDFLLSRVSPPIPELKEPGPDDAAIETLIRVASHVPDHGRLAPWRFVVYRGEARHAIGRALAELAEREQGPLTEGRRSQELIRFSRAPVVIGVISSPPQQAKIPEWEMFLSGAAAAMSLEFAAKALGFASNWVTNWYAESAEGRRILGLSPRERVVGFVHLGTFAGEPAERPRPDVKSLYADYSGPWPEA